MPETLARFLLRRRWIIKPGLESTNPDAAVDRYLGIIGRINHSIIGKRVLVFGYGGRFAVGVKLLERGAGHVILCDHLPSMDQERNLQLLPQYEKYLQLDRQDVTPQPQFITLLHGDIRDVKVLEGIGKADLVLSTSVFEHLADVPGITASLTNVTQPKGMHVHFIDLRDHFFKYPFEMLTYSEGIWRSLLNPTSNLNRLRMPEYQKQFEKHFRRVDISVLARKPDEYDKVKRRIRREFISGDPAIDSVTQICLVASELID